VYGILWFIKKRVRPDSPDFQPKKVLKSAIAGALAGAYCWYAGIPVSYATVETLMLNTAIVIAADWLLTLLLNLYKRIRG